MCLPRSLPTSSPRRRGQRGARAAQRARTTLTLTSGDARSAARKALAGQHAQRRAIGAQPNCLDPLKNRRKTGTNHSPAAPAQNLCLRRRNPSSNPFGDPHSCRKTHKKEYEGIPGKGHGRLRRGEGHPASPHGKADRAAGRVPPNVWSPPGAERMGLRLVAGWTPRRMADPTGRGRRRIRANPGLR